MKPKTLLLFKNSLKKIHDDWEIITHTKSKLENQDFLQKLSNDIKDLDEKAIKTKKLEKYREKAEFIHYLLTTPWGAPFVGNTTLLEAANKNEKTKLHNLMKNFEKYSHVFKTQIFEILENISKEL